MSYPARAEGLVNMVRQYPTGEGNKAKSIEKKKNGVLKKKVYKIKGGGEYTVKKKKCTTRHRKVS